MHSWESIQSVIDHIEENLNEEISIEELARVAALSPFYFQRLFRRLVKKPVREYTKMRRLSKACEMLLETDRKVADIAEEFYFSGHANFTRAFKNAFGITPDEYRQAHVIMNQYVKPNLLLNYVIVDENVPLVTDGIVLEVTRKKLDKPKPIIGIAKEIPISDIMGGHTSGVSVTGALWDEFHEKKGLLFGLIPDGNECGIVYMGDAKEGFCMYLAGAEAESKNAPEGFSVFYLPAEEYVICGFEAESFQELVTSTVYKAQVFMERWMQKHKLGTTDFAAEIYYPVTNASAYMETWLVPVTLES